MSIGNDTAIVICSNTREIIAQLAKRADFEKLSIYVYLNEKILYLNEVQKTKFIKNIVDDTNKRFYQLVAQKCNVDNEYVDKKIADVDKKVIVSATQLVLTTNCTLNCRECFAGKPYCSKHEFFELNFLKQQLDTFLECIDECIELELIGGEVFLYPDLVEIIEYCLKQDKVQMVYLTTNGTIVPNKEVMNILKNDRVVVAISEYQCIKYENVENELNKLGINWYGINTKWTAMPTYNKISNCFESYKYTQEDLELAYYRCPNRMSCYAILNNKFYVCYRTAMLDYTGNYDFSSNEYANLSLPFDERKKEVLNILHKCFTEACNYCGMGNLFSFKEELLEPGEQL